MKNRYKETRNQKVRRPLSLHMQRRLHEGWFLICMMCGLFLLISILTYHVSDPGWTSSGLSPKVANWGGRVGAWLADVMFTLFGVMAYFFPVLIILSSWLRLKEHDLAERKWYEKLLSLLGWLCLILSSAALANFYITIKLSLPAEAGGIVGDVVGSGLALLLNRAGSTLVFVTLLLFGMTLVTGLSWLTLIDMLGEYSAHLADGLTKKMRTQWQKIKNIKWRQKTKASKVIAKEPVLSPPAASVVKAAAPVSAPAKTTPIVVTQLQPQIKDVDFAPAKKTADEKTSDKTVKPKKGVLPDLDLLNSSQPHSEQAFADISFTDLSQLVEQRLADFGVEVKVVAVHPGPVITRFELDLAPGIKVSKITGLAKDIARSLSVVSVRIVEVIPGKSVIGLEIPNENREMVTLRDMFQSDRYLQSHSPMTLVLGKDIAGHAVVVDLAKMPHLLVAGTTGSGKSVSLNAMLLSMLYKSTPEQLRFIMIDPKMLELSIYDGIPHLLTPVITDMKNAANALRWCVAEMDKRYRLMAALGVRNLSSYNQQVNDAIKSGEPLMMPGSLVTDEESAKTSLNPLPVIVVVVDELADMMMVVGKKVEDLIARIAQKARAAGIHLILATQRPSVDVITGLIKANIPTRIAFQVSSRIDSRTILDQQGAEQLLGHGDMLYLPPGAGMPTRVHGAYVADEEVHRVVKAWRGYGQPDYIYEVTDDNDETNNNDNNQSSGEQDAFYDEAVRIVIESQRASISLVQRRLRIGYNRAARMMEEMEARGIVSQMDTNGSREVLVKEPIY